VIEANNGGLVSAPAQSGVKETGCGVLFKADFAANAAARVHHQRDVQRQVRFAAEVRNVLLLIIFKDFEVISSQVRDEPAALAGDREKNIDALHVHGQRGIVTQERLLDWTLRGFSQAQSEETHEYESHAHARYDAYGIPLYCAGVWPT
jgi:hypothetical protein